jgi:hypothetical protein
MENAGNRQFNDSMAFLSMGVGRIFPDLECGDLSPLCALFFFQLRDHFAPSIAGGVFFSGS